MRSLFCLTVAGICIAVASCTNDTPSVDSAASVATGSPATASRGTAIVPWNDSLRDIAKAELCSLDATNGQKAINGSFNLQASQPVAFEGWVSTSKRRNPGSFSIVLQGTPSFEIKFHTGVQRPDVAQAYKSTELLDAGYKMELPALPVPTGNYSVLLVHDEIGEKFACDTKQHITVN